MAQFQIDYKKVMSQATSMGNLAFDLGEEIVNLENLLEKVKKEWCGPASDAYQHQLTILIADMKVTKKRMSDVSQTIKEVADRIHRTDDKLSDQLIDSNNIFL